MDNKTRRKSFFILFLFVIILPIAFPTFQYFPEDFMDIDYLTTNANEIFMAAYYFIDPVVSLPSVNKYDYRNGVIIYPINDVFILYII